MIFERLKKQVNKHARSTKKLWWLTILLMLACPMAQGQTTFSSITGTVTDPSNAVVEGARVTVTNTGTGITRRVRTNARGVYVVPDLDIGEYEISIEKRGFMTFKQLNIHLNADRTVNINAQLSVASAGQTVKVVGSTSTLDTQDGTISSLISHKQLRTMPTVTRQRGDEAIFGYALYNNGVSERGCTGCGIVANGSTTQAQQVTVDGITVMGAEQGGGSTVQTGMGATAEVNLQLADPSAEFSQPVQLSMVSKGGTNQFHGGAFEDYNGNALNSGSYFDSRVPFRVYNNFGVHLGGPIIKKNTFFFVDYEGSREATVVVDTSNAPLAAWRNGDFSELGKPLINPYTKQPFPNNQIPASMISPVSKKIQNLYFPAPNFGSPTLEAGNYRLQVRPGVNGATNYDLASIRIDHQFNHKDSAFVRFSYNRVPINAYLSPALPPFGYRTSVRLGNSGTISWTHIFNTNLLNEARVGFARDNNAISSPIVGSSILQQVGIQGISVAGYKTYPRFGVTGLTSPVDIPNYRNLSKDIEWNDALTWVHGLHTIKVGFDAIYDNQLKFSYSSDVYGSYSFDGFFTGSPYADFLLGLPLSTGVTAPTPVVDEHGDWLGAYIEDMYKVTPRLTASYGLRWEAQLPYTESHGEKYNFNPSNGDLVVPDKGFKRVSALYPKNIPIETASEARYPANTLVDSHHAYFYPRIALAYSPSGSGNTVIRGAYGIYSLPTYGQVVGTMAGGPFSGSQSFTNSIHDGKALFSFPEPFLTSGKTPTQNVRGVNPHLRIGYMQQWNLTVEHEVAGVTFGISYIGTHTVGMPFTQDINRPVPSTAPYSISEVPYKDYFHVDWLNNGYYNSYDGLQFEAKDYYRKNLFVNTGFTWAKDLNGSHSVDAIYHNEDNYGNSSLTPRLTYFGQAVYQLPVGRGQAFLSNASRPLNVLIGGWSSAWQFDWHTGWFFTPSFSSFDTSNTRTFGGRPDVVPGVYPYARNKTINGWLNPAAFKIPGCPNNDTLCAKPADVGRFGDAGINTLAGPSWTVLGLSMMKDFRVYKSANLEFRATASNLFNHPLFANPAANISVPRTYGVITATYYNMYGEQARMIDFMMRLKF